MTESQHELVIYWDRADQIFVAEFPELPGCAAHGSNRSEAVTNAEAASELWLETAREDGVAVSKPRGKLIFGDSTRRL